MVSQEDKSIPAKTTVESKKEDITEEPQTRKRRENAGTHWKYPEETYVMPKYEAALENLVEKEKASENPHFALTRYTLTKGMNLFGKEA